MKSQLALSLVLVVSSAYVSTAYAQTSSTLVPGASAAQGQTPPKPGSSASNLVPGAASTTTTGAQSSKPTATSTTAGKNGKPGKSGKVTKNSRTNSRVAANLKARLNALKAKSPAHYHQAEAYVRQYRRANPRLTAKSVWFDTAFLTGFGIELNNIFHQIGEALTPPPAAVAPVVVAEDEDAPYNPNPPVVQPGPVAQQQPEAAAPAATKCNCAAPSPAPLPQRTLDPIRDISNRSDDRPERVIVEEVPQTASRRASNIASPINNGGNFGLPSNLLSNLLPASYPAPNNGQYGYNPYGNNNPYGLGANTNLFNGIPGQANPYNNFGRQLLPASYPAPGGYNPFNTAAGLGGFNSPYGNNMNFGTGFGAPGILPYQNSTPYFASGLAQPFGYGNQFASAIGGGYGGYSGYIPSFTSGGFGGTYGFGGGAGFGGFGGLSSGIYGGSQAPRVLPYQGGTTAPAALPLTNTGSVYNQAPVTLPYAQSAALH